MSDPQAWWHDEQPGGGHRHAFDMRLLERTSTAVGDVEIFAHDYLGRVFAVGGRVRWVESDPTYVEMAVHPVLLGQLRPGARVLVLGGDDGALVREVLRHDSVARVVVAPADLAVTEVARRWIEPASALADPRVELLDHGPGRAGVRPLAERLSEEAPFDVIISDLFLSGPVAALDAVPWISAGGALVTAAGLVIARDRPGFVPGARLIPTSAATLPAPERYVIATPTLPGGWVAFHVYGPGPAASHREPRAERRFRHYHPAIHRAAFALPTWWRDGVAEHLPPLPAEARAIATWWHEHTEGTGISHALDMRPAGVEQSPFQKIELFEHPVYGKVLALDETIQGSEGDEAIYHELAVHVPLLGGARPRKRVLIVGGGDGGAAREVLKHPEVEELVMVEIDQRVIELSNSHFPIQGPPDPRFTTLVMDAADYVAAAVERGEKFDCVIIDATDSTEPSKSLWNDRFFENLVACLADDGVCLDSDILVSGLEGGLLSRDRPGAPLAVIGRAKRFFGQLEGFISRVPLYPGGYFVFFLYTKDGRSHAEPRSELSARFYNADVHRAAFALPAWYQELLARV